MAVGPGPWEAFAAEVPPEPEQGQAVIVSRDARLLRMRRSVNESARLIQEQLTASGFRFKAAMLTLTYRDDVEYSPRQISDLLQHIRKWLKRRGAQFVAYVWVMELTQRGRPHYHILVWLPKGLTLPKPDRQGWWPWGSTRIEWARSAVNYLAKYSSKAQGQGADSSYVIPERARLHGNGGLDALRRRIRRWRLFPQWVRDVFTFDDDPMRAKGGGFIARATGELHESPWRLLDHASNYAWLRFQYVGDDGLPA